MLNVEVDEKMVRELMKKAIDERVDELAKERYFLSYKELSSYLNISIPVIEEKLLKNGLPYYRNGSRYLFKRDEVDAFLDEVTARMSMTQNDLKFFEGLKK